METIIEDPTLELFKNYTLTIKSREEARCLAEKCEKDRKAAWRSFYKLTEELDKLEKEIHREGTSSVPDAPKKKGKRKAAEVSLSEQPGQDERNRYNHSTIDLTQ